MGERGDDKQCMVAEDAGGAAAPRTRFECIYTREMTSGL